MSAQLLRQVDAWHAGANARMYDICHCLFRNGVCPSVDFPLPILFVQPTIDVLPKKHTKQTATGNKC